MRSVGYKVKSLHVVGGAIYRITAMVNVKQPTGRYINAHVKRVRKRYDIVILSLFLNVPAH